jgi:hypothetical protein
VVLEALATRKEELHCRMSMVEAFKLLDLKGVLGGSFEVQRDR